MPNPEFLDLVRELRARGTCRRAPRPHDAVPDIGFRPAKLPKKPTDASPGSEEKIRVMIERARRREQLFHPRDGRLAERQGYAGYQDNHGNVHQLGLFDPAAPAVKTTTSEHTGVSRHASGRWRAQITIEGDQVYLGLFATQEEAAAAYQEAAGFLRRADAA